MSKDVLKWLDEAHAGHFVDLDEKYAREVYEALCKFVDLMQ